MLETIQNNTSIPLFKYKVLNHLDIKNVILNDIEKMGEFSFKTEFQKISNTDWHLGTSIQRDYQTKLVDIFIEIENFINNLYETVGRIKVVNYWFQQYKLNDFHGWHVHPGNLFSAIYYLDVNSETPKTTFRLFDKSEMEIEMNEGEILIFPSFLEHISKPNKSEKTKTIISFNIN
jgi:hypothetical protein